MMASRDRRISRLLTIGREAAIEELRQLALADPAEFLDLVALLLDQADAHSTPGEPIHTNVTFVIHEQTDSRNRT